MGELDASDQGHGAAEQQKSSHTKACCSQLMQSRNSASGARRRINSASGARRRGNNASAARRRGNSASVG